MNDTALIDEFPSVPDPVTETAKNVFGINYLFPWQRLVIANILDAVHDSTEKDAERSAWSRQIVLLPTGAGKSLCFLLPAAMLDRPTLIIYPLLALMSDQKRRMDSSNLEAVVFRGGQSPEEREENFRRIHAGAKVILANPEVLQSEALVRRLADCNIVHAAIDEAHCTAEWGDSFRPAYLKLGEILTNLKIPVITAFTATASESVLRRAAEVLFGGEAHIVRSDSDRANLRYRVHYAYRKQKAALRLAIEVEKPLIVFCGTRKRAEDTARLFQAYFGKDRVRFYHAGLTRDEKKTVETWFFPRDDAILCATCAFGMGVDKSNIRTVIHLDPPATAEAYIQEAGRGGRDGGVSNAILLWNPADSKRAESFAAGSRERVLADFAESKTCRRQVLLDALGGEQAPCSGCDICDGNAEMEAADARAVLDFFKKNGSRFTLTEAKNELRTQFNTESAAVLGMRIWEHEDFETIVGTLVEEKRLVVPTRFLETKIAQIREKWCTLIFADRKVAAS